jgi:hypothetical protein
MVRQFNLINEKGQTYSLMDIQEYCLLTSPTGLGFSYSIQYEQLGNTFVQTLRKLEQGSINGQVNFLNYQNYKNYVDFVAKSDEIKLQYTIPYKDTSKTFYRDIDIQSTSKGEIQPNGVIQEQVSINCKSLWYEKIAQQYQISATSNEVRWDFRFDSYWSGYTVRELDYINTGHVDASVEVAIDGECVNPSINLYIEGTLFQTITVSDTIDVYEKLLYSSKEGDFYIRKQLTDGTYDNLFSLEYISFENDNVLRIPPNKDCTITLTADEDIEKAVITIYVYYISV